jgi:hypothetical protein
MTGDTIHELYLPFTQAELQQHFATVGKAADGRHLKYYLASAERWADYERRQGRGSTVTATHGLQMEKDERFWIATALMSLYHRAPNRSSAFASLFNAAQLPPPRGYPGWAEALDSTLHLYFETNLPAPRKYQAWLKNHLDERSLVPHLRQRAASAGRVEGATKADAVLIADNGVAVVFEAKVLSDVSTHVTYDAARNQLARLIDVMLEPPGATNSEVLRRREPDLTSLVLVTPELLHRRTSGGLHRSRLYGWLMDAYTQPSDPTLERHLPHRDPDMLTAVAHRLGWASWDDFNRIHPASCPWLDEWPVT